ncbi:MAG: OmpH family outer membrane protein [Candidatus Eisenbacteria bacterium]
MERGISWVARGGVALAVLAAGFAAGPLGAAETKIGYIDSSRIFAEYRGTEDAQRSFDEEVQGWVRQAETMKAEIDSLEREFQSQSLMLSDARKGERKQVINEKKAAYESFTQSVWGPQGKIADKNSELVQPIIEKINVVLRRLGEEEGYTIVLDAGLGGIVYAAEGLDLTDRILEELNQGIEGAKAP